MERVTTKEAADELGIGVETVKGLMRQGRLPIGTIYRKDKRSKRATYIIYREWLNNYKEGMNGNDGQTVSFGGLYESD